jgi:hypothetical protein
MKNLPLLRLILLAALIAGCQQTGLKSKPDQISAGTANATSLKHKADTGSGVNSDTLHISHAGNKYLGEILRMPDKDAVQCGRWLEENLFGFDYDFDNESTVRIYSLFIEKVRSKPCLKGNTLHFAFNKQTKRFDLSRISWQTSYN